MRRLMIAHLREEWRLLILRPLPLLALMAVAVATLVPASRLGDFSGHGESPFRLGILFPVAGVFAGLPGALVLLEGESYRAAWLLAQSGLDPERMTAAMRGIARGLFGAPLAMLILVVDLRSGAGWGATLSDLGLTLLLFEIVVRILQSRHLAWPFARPWGSPPDDSVLVMAVAFVPISATLLLWQGLVCERWWTARVITVLLLAAALVVADRHLSRRLRERGLSLELAAPVGEA